MRKDCILKPKPGLQLRRIGKKYIIVDNQSGKVNVSDVFSLNETAADLWKRMEAGDNTPEKLVSWICEVYKVDRETAQKDVNTQLEDWIKFGLVYENK